jgi:LysM repeat protein
VAKASDKPQTPPPLPPRLSYRVRSGDTLYRIALKHGVTVAEILAINSLGGRDPARRQAQDPREGPVARPAG